MTNQTAPSGNSSNSKLNKKQTLVTDQTFIDRVAERVYQLLLADLRREQERRGKQK